MKRLTRWTLTMAVSAMMAGWNVNALAQLLQFATQLAAHQHTTLTIHADGSCRLLNETVQSRATAEQEIRMMERLQEMTEGGPQEPSAATNSAVAKAKPLSDKQLAKKLQDLMGESFGATSLESPGQTHIEVTNNNVRIETVRSFKTLKDLLREGPAIWGQAGFMFSGARFETDTNGLLRLTLTPQRGVKQFLKLMRAQWQLAGSKTELKLVFPGKVVSSDFPETRTNATWFLINGTNDASMDAAVKLYAKPVVITAQAGGLKLKEPLDSTQLQGSSLFGSEAGSNLPITAAGPGFVAEPLAISTTTLHVFPQGTNYFENNVFGNSQQSGVLVTAKLFAPRGRTLLSVSDVRVLNATDDKGRAVKPLAENDNEVSSYTSFGDSSQESSGMQFQLHLELPAQDAHSISNLDGEAIAVTAGKWNEMKLTNIQQNATNQLDLGAVLPGAKLAVTQFEEKNSQVNIQVRITGPKTIRRLQLEAKIPGNDSFSSNVMDRQFRSHHGEASRRVWIQGFGVSPGGINAQSLVLVIRYPMDLRRQRVPFDLKGLDLF